MDFVKPPNSCFPRSFDLAGTPVTRDPEREATHLSYFDLSPVKPARQISYCSQRIGRARIVLMQVRFLVKSLMNTHSLRREPRQKQPNLVNFVPQRCDTSCGT